MKFEKVEAAKKVWIKPQLRTLNLSSDAIDSLFGRKVGRQDLATKS